MCTGTASYIWSLLQCMPTGVKFPHLHPSYVATHVIYPVVLFKALILLVNTTIYAYAPLP